MKNISLLNNKRDFLDSFDQLFDSFWAVPTKTRPARGFSALCDIIEKEDAFEMSFDLPGMDKEDINIEVKAGDLVVSGERETENEFKEGQTSRFERSYGSFYRSFRLPDNVDPESIEAKYDKGVLTLRLPKSEVSESKKVKVS